MDVPAWTVILIQRTVGVVVQLALRAEKDRAMSRGCGCKLLFGDGAVEDVWILGHVAWAGAAGEWRHNGDIKVRGGAILMKSEIHACVFDRAIHHTREGWNGLFDVHLGATVRLYQISKAPGRCGMPTIDTTAVAAPGAMVLLRVNRFAADLTRCTLVEACQNNT